jgi:hypothetical protein
MNGGHREDTLNGDEGSLRISVDQSSFPLNIWLQATGNSPEGKGSRGPVPLVLNLEAYGLTVRPGSGLNWKLSLRALPPDADRDRNRGSGSHNGKDSTNTRKAEHTHGTS